MSNDKECPLTTTSNVLEKDYQDVIEKLRTFFFQYHSHKYACEPACEPAWAIRAAEMSAFNVLIVLAGKREAMLFQSDKDPRNEELAEESHTQLLSLYANMAIFMQKWPTYKIACRIGGFYVYHIDMQMHLDQSDLSRFLGYLSPFEPNKWSHLIRFSLNRTDFLVFGCTELSFTNLTVLKHRLRSYQAVASCLGGQVRFALEFSD